LKLKWQPLFNKLNNGCHRGLGFHGAILAYVVPTAQKALGRAHVPQLVVVHKCALAKAMEGAMLLTLRWSKYLRGRGLIFLTIALL